MDSVGLASIPPPAVDVLSVPGGLFNPSEDHRQSWAVQDFQVCDLSRHPEPP